MTGAKPPRRNGIWQSTGFDGVTLIGIKALIKNNAEN